MATMAAVAVADLETLRVTFSTSVDATALGPDQWSLACISDPPFALPAISEVRGVDGPTSTLAVDLVLFFALSPGKTYQVTVTGGNTVERPVPSLPAVAGRQFNFLRWMSDVNLREDDTRDLRNLVACLDEQLTIHLFDVDRWGDIQDPDLADAQYVDQMLADLGCPFDDVVSTLERKRVLLKCLVALYKQIGTLDGLRNAIWFFSGYEVDVTVGNRQGMRLGTSLLGIDWVLGCGPNKWWLLVKIHTPNGRAFTVYETRLLEQIVRVMQYAQDQVVVQAALPAPTGVAAAASSSPTGIRVSWSAVTGASTYVVYMRSQSGVTIRNASPHVAVSTSLDLLMPAGKHRYFRVVGVNAQGEGLVSAEVDAVSG